MSPAASDEVSRAVADMPNNKKLMQEMGQRNLALTRNEYNWRKNTERPSTVEIGTNELVEFDPKLVETKLNEVLQGRFKKGRVPELWYGSATERIFEQLVPLL